MGFGQYHDSGRGSEATCCFVQNTGQERRVLGGLQLVTGGVRVKVPSRKGVIMQGLQHTTGTDPVATEGWRLSFINSLWQHLLCDGTGETFLWRKNAEFIIRKPYFSSWLCSLFSTAKPGGGVMISWVLSAVSRSYSYPEVLGKCSAFPPFDFLWNVDVHLWPLLIQVKVLWSYEVLWLHP